MAKENGRGLIAAIIGVGAIGLVAVVLASVALGSRRSTATPPAATAPPSIVVTGDGSVTGVPDMLGFNVRVSLTRPDVATAMDDASRSMKRVFAAVGVQKKDIQTKGLSIDPSYLYSNNTERLVGYTVTQSARIQVRDLREAGRALAAAAAAGGNAVRIDGVGLSISDRSGLMAQARRAVVADARAKAQAYAGASGRHLGGVLSLKEASRQPVAPDGFDRLAGLSAVRSAAVPIRAGEKNMSVQIQIVWELR